MKKIAIVTRQMIAGGIEKSLISMLWVIQKERFDITLFVMGSGGEFEQFIPKWVKVKNIYGDEKTTKEKIINKLKQGKLIDSLKIGVCTIKALRTKPGYQQEKILAKILPKEYEVFDLAIAYHVPASFPVIYVVDHLKSKKKVAWIHSDVEVYKQHLINYIDYYNKFEKIYCVSKHGKYKFDIQYPHLKEKTQVFYNIINQSQLEILAQENADSFDDEFDGIRILTVARLTQEKGCDILPSIVASLIKTVNVKWYIIGDGEEREEIYKEIEKYNIQDKLILLGTRTNPYPYFKNCDIYVQPSRHEGYCITLAEARTFNKPIVSTDFIGAREQIVDEETGFIVKFNKDEICSAIKMIINDEKVKSKFINNLKNYNVDTTKEIEKLYEFVEGV